MSELIDIVADIESGDQDVTPEIGTRLRRAGAWIDADDDAPDDMGSDTGALWVVSTRRLMIGQAARS